jgi:hypothetical protein
MIAIDLHDKHVLMKAPANKTRSIRLTSFRIFRSHFNWPSVFIPTHLFFSLGGSNSEVTAV